MKQLLTLLLLALSVQLFAQSYPITSITISLPANPNANTANWGTGTPQFMISATAKAVNGRVDIAVESSKILVTIKKGSSKICGVYTSGSAPSANFNAQTKVWSGSTALSLLGQDCTLQPGDYELSVQFFGNGPAGLMTLSEERTKGFTIRGTDQQTFQAPQALMPSNGSVFKETDLQKPISFRWTAVVPKPQEPTTYRLKVWQLMQGQNGMQAVKANQPIYTKDIDNLTQATVNNIITGPCKPPYLCSFVWNVQALNRDGKPIGGNNGTSESFEFGSKATEESIAPPILRQPANGETIATGKQQVFSWLAPMPTASGPVTYKIKIVEIKGDQSPENAFRTNKPFFERDSIELLNIPFPSSATAFVAGRQYAWGVQAFNREGKTVGSNDGKSEVFSFKAQLSAGCGTVITDSSVQCNGWNQQTGLPIYNISITLQNIPTSSSLACNVKYNSLAIFSGGGSISGVSTLPIIIPPNGSQTISFTYSPPNLSTTIVKFRVNGNWTDPLNNPIDELVTVGLPSCICKDCDKAVLNANGIQATQVPGNPSQYNISGNFSFSGLPQNVQAVEVQVQSFSFNNSPNACSNGVQSVATSGVLVNPSTTINNIVPVFQNATVLNNTNLSKNIKLIIGGNGLPQPTAIPFNLTVGVPAPLPGLPADCCKIEYEMCFKVIIYYGSSPGKCRYCEFIFCKSFSNK